MRFGRKYGGEMAAHRVKWTDPYMQDEIAKIGRQGPVEWEMAVPEAGRYVLTFSSNASRPDRIGRLSVELAGQWKEFGIMDVEDDYHTPLDLPKGPTRFRVSPGPKDGSYLSGARLSRPRGNPWQGMKGGVRPRLLFTASEIAKIRQTLAADPEHPARYFYDGLLKQARDNVARPEPLEGSRDSCEALNAVAMAYALTGEKEFAARAIDYLQRLHAVTSDAILPRSWATASTCRASPGPTTSSIPV